MAVEQACWPKSGCARNCRRVEAAKPRTWVIHNASAATKDASAVFMVLVLVIVLRSLQIERTIKRTRNENDRTPKSSRPATTWTDSRTKNTELIQKEASDHATPPYLGFAMTKTLILRA